MAFPDALIRNAVQLGLSDTQARRLSLCYSVLPNELVADGEVDIEHLRSLAPILDRRWRPGDDPTALEA